ncbi:MAG: PD40 domain-containing protein [Proteobacteria bacterium]|nr:PD40 domain-containing protein [Pseudomonadota bacterium]
MDDSTLPDYEFEGFRLDTALQVLVGPGGVPVPLPSRAFETLRLLVEHAGELVERSVLMKTVWPRTVVEENNLSQCIVTLRRALGEEAGERRFILTIPGRGFKFVAPVRVVPRTHARARAPVAVPFEAAAPPVATADQPAPVLARPSRRASAGFAVFAVAVVALAGYLVATRERPVTVPAEYEPLTDVADIATAPALSPDGRLLAYIKGGDAFLSTGQIWLRLLPDGEPRQLTHGGGWIFGPTFTPDGTHVAYTAIREPSVTSTWETWTVPITGGEPTLLLPNASGLTFTGPHEVLYSEFKTGLHLGIVASLDDRAQHREVYLPAHERGMAHFSYLSPDRRSVLIVEMGRNGDFQRCRLAPYDGHNAGAPIGPDGECGSAAWSPDGRWMYLAARVAGHSHLWRQRYPDGEPQQITFGPTEEETVVIAPDGRSLLTSIGRDQSSIWLHDRTGEHVLTSTSFVLEPWLSDDARRLYFLAARSSTDPSELSRLEIATGSKELLLAGFAVSSYDVSYDEQQVAFVTKRSGVPEVWLAPLDRHAAPRRLAVNADQAAFDREGRVYFRSLGEHDNSLHRITPASGLEERVLPAPILEFDTISPDGTLAVVDLPVQGKVGGAYVARIGGGAPQLLATGWWPSRWSRSGRTLYLEVGAGDDTQRHGRTLALPVRDDGVLEPVRRPLPAEATVIPHQEYSLAFGADVATYAYVRWETRRNIYRVPLHD